MINFVFFAFARQPYYITNTNATVFEHVFCDLVPNTEYTIGGRVKPMTSGFWSEVKDAKVTTLKAGKFKLGMFSFHLALSTSSSSK